MAAVMDLSEVTAVRRARPRAVRRTRLPITLYDLITAIQDVVGLLVGRAPELAVVQQYLGRLGELLSAWPASVSTARRFSALAMIAGC